MNHAHMRCTTARATLLLLCVLTVHKPLASTHPHIADLHHARAHRTIAHATLLLLCVLTFHNSFISPHSLTSHTPPSPLLPPKEQHRAMAKTKGENFKHMLTKPDNEKPTNHKYHTKHQYNQRNSATSLQTPQKPTRDHLASQLLLCDKLQNEKAKQPLQRQPA